MKIIGAIGGGGSTFILRSLQQYNYKSFYKFHPFKYRVRLEKKPHLINTYNFCIRLINFYKPNFQILMRPDSYWTDWSFNKRCIYDPNDKYFKDDLIKQKKYLYFTKDLRSCGIKIDFSKIKTDSLKSLVYSYIMEMKRIEKKRRYEIVLLCGHWAEYGILKELNLKTIYIVRDPFNSFISHSNKIRHQEDYLRRGYDNINTKEWINAYLEGPHHFWINFAKSALEHKNSIIIRYSHFKNDWYKVKALPDITSYFKYNENDVTGILTDESIEYIRYKTQGLCKRLKIPIY